MLVAGLKGWQSKCRCTTCDQLVPPVTVHPPAAPAATVQLPDQKSSSNRTTSFQSCGLLCNNKSNYFTHVVINPRISVAASVKEICHQRWALRCPGQDREGFSLTDCCRAQPGFQGARTVQVHPSPMETTLSLSSSMGEHSLTPLKIAPSRMDDG